MFCRKCGENIPEDSAFCVRCGVAVIASSSPMDSTTGIVSDATATLEPKILSNPSGNAINVSVSPTQGSLLYRSRTRVIKKFALLSVMALLFSGYLIFSFAPSEGYNIEYSTFSFVGFGIGLTLVLLPAILAAYSDHPRFVWVMLVNIFFSWTIIFWIIALIWSVRGRKSRFAETCQDLSGDTESPALPSSRFSELLSVDLSGRWYIRLLKVVIAVIGAVLLVAVIFFLYGLIRGVLGTLP